MDEATLVDLLPDPNRDLYLQHISPAIGAFPEVVPLTYALRFSAAEKSGWRLDTARLVKAAREAAEARRLESPIQSNANLYSQQQEAFSSITPQNLFERDFTLSFWLQRQPTDNDDHETILCSQEDSGKLKCATSRQGKIEARSRDPQQGRWKHIEAIVGEGLQADLESVATNTQWLVA